MPGAKTHASIGAVCGLGLTGGMSYLTMASHVGQSSPLTGVFSTQGILMIGMSTVGSLVPDLDHDISTATSSFSKILLYGILLVSAEKLFDLHLLSQFSAKIPLSILGLAGIALFVLGKLFGGSKDHKKAWQTWGFVILMILALDRFIGMMDSKNFPLITFVVLCVLARLSPHRQFTHKILGTVLFGVSTFFLLPLPYFLAFEAGYISHILADKTTKAGLHFVDLKLPCQNSEGKIHVDLTKLAGSH